MHLYLLADVRSTETWSLGHLIGVVIVVVVVLWLFNRFRVGRRR